MAAFSHVGAHCAVTTCHQQDFLPFRCDCCHKEFCGEHRTYASHECAVYDGSDDVVAPECPICGEVVVPSGFKPGDDPNRAIDAHLSLPRGSPGSCRGERSAAADDPSVLTDVQRERSFGCGVARCKTRELVEMRCHDCDRHFCVHHRYADSHDCPAAAARATAAASAAGAAAERRAAVTSRSVAAVGALVDRFRGARETPTAKRVAEMRLKTRSKAASRTPVPEEKRFFLEVDFSLSSAARQAASAKRAESGASAAELRRAAAATTRLLYFNRDWTVGKVLDLVADAVGVVNRNNEPGARRLELVSLSSAEPLKTSVSLADYEEGNLLHSGDGVALVLHE